MSLIKKGECTILRCKCTYLQSDRSSFDIVEYIPKDDVISNNQIRQGIKHSMDGKYASLHKLVAHLLSHYYQQKWQKANGSKN